MSKEARRLPHSHQGRRGALFYASISIVMPDLNSTVKWSAKTVIFSMSFLTRASSNSVMSVSDVAAADAAAMLEKVSVVNEAQHYYKAKLGLKDMQFCIDFALLLNKYAV